MNSLQYIWSGIQRLAQESGLSIQLKLLNAQHKNVLKQSVIILQSSHSRYCIPAIDSRIAIGTANVLTASIVADDHVTEYLRLSIIDFIKNGVEEADCRKIL